MRFNYDEASPNTLISPLHAPTAIGTVKLNTDHHTTPVPIELVTLKRNTLQKYGYQETEIN